MKFRKVKGGELWKSLYMDKNNARRIDQAVLKAVRETPSLNGDEITLKVAPYIRDVNEAFFAATMIIHRCSEVRKNAHCAKTAETLKENETV